MYVYLGIDESGCKLSVVLANIFGYTHEGMGLGTADIDVRPLNDLGSASVI
jgi:hypothetical protein